MVLKFLALSYSESLIDKIISFIRRLNNRGNKLSPCETPEINWTLTFTWDPRP